MKKLIEKMERTVDESVNELIKSKELMEKELRQVSDRMKELKNNLLITEKEVNKLTSFKLVIKNFACEIENIREQNPQDIFNKLDKIINDEDRKEILATVARPEVKRTIISGSRHERNEKLLLGSAYGKVLTLRNFEDYADSFTTTRLFNRKEVCSYINTYFDTRIIGPNQLYKFLEKIGWVLHVNKDNGINYPYITEVQKGNIYCVRAGKKSKRKASGTLKLVLTMQGIEELIKILSTTN